MNGNITDAIIVAINETITKAITGNNAALMLDLSAY